MELFCKKKSCSTIKLFFFFKYVLYSTVLSKYLKKKSGVTVLVSSQTAVKGGHRFEIAVRMENLRGGGTGTRHKMALIVFKVCTRIEVCFGCFYVFDIANTEIHTWKEGKNNKE